MKVNIIFDGPPGHKAGRLVEVEDFETGKSVGVGHWWPQGNGLWALTLDVGFQEKHPSICSLYLLPPKRCDCGIWDT